MRKPMKLVVERTIVDNLFVGPQGDICNIEKVAELIIRNLRNHGYIK